ncbi:hypothetical protein RI129_001233 [Pyrocoelia pectoralis]|uniref:Uncharacterized protein n=1 Tax=Pyrocoelia pectoralis TaxID=417401 RepID=A0AAN7VV09_9COLE
MEESEVDGNIYARGSQDTKCLGIQYLEAIRRLVLDEVKLKRTIHVSFVPDEEIGGKEGMNLFVLTPEFRHLNIGFALDEGAPSPINEICVYASEKYGWKFAIHCPGTPGHGCLMLENTAGEKVQYLLNKFYELRKESMSRFKQTSDYGHVISINLTMMQVSLSRLKESVAPSELDKTPETVLEEYYPFATVLRFRVLQIVCGISFLIVGTVAFIEERGELNLSLGIPAGGSTIIAAATSIHTTKGFGGYRASTCHPNSPFRFLGPSIRVAVLIAVLWGSACSFVTALVIQSIRTITGTHVYEVCDEFVQENATDITILAIVELSLSLITLLSVSLLVRIDCRYDPD